MNDIGFADDDHNDGTNAGNARNNDITHINNAMITLVIIRIAIMMKPTMSMLFLVALSMLMIILRIEIIMTIVTFLAWLRLVDFSLLLAAHSLPIRNNTQSIIPDMRTKPKLSLFIRISRNKLILEAGNFVKS